MKVMHLHLLFNAGHGCIVWRVQLLRMRAAIAAPVTLAIINGRRAAASSTSAGRPSRKRERNC